MTTHEYVAQQAAEIERLRTLVANTATRLRTLRHMAALDKRESKANSFTEETRNNNEKKK